MDNELLNKEIQDRTIHFIGLGSFGSNALEIIYNKGVKAKYTYICYPKRKHLPADIDFIYFIPPGKIESDEMIERFKRPDMNVELVVPDEILALFNEDHRFILLSGVGGYTGTFMTEKLTKFLIENNKDFFVICRLPLSWEFQKKPYAEEIRLKFQGLSNFRIFESDLLFKNYGNIKLKDAFEKLDEEFYNIFLEIFP
jgi:cell division GTPase FtsZ